MKKCRKKGCVDFPEALCFQGTLEGELVPQPAPALKSFSSISSDWHAGPTVAICFVCLFHLFEVFSTGSLAPMGEHGKVEVTPSGLYPGPSHALLSALQRTAGFLGRTCLVLYPQQTSSFFERTCLAL